MNECPHIPFGIVTVFAPDLSMIEYHECKACGRKLTLEEANKVEKIISKEITACMLQPKRELSDDEYRKLALDLLNGCDPKFDSDSVGWLKLAAEISRLNALK